VILMVGLAWMGPRAITGKPVISSGTILEIPEG
jgi:hypothetical protein